ncbi:MAG: beta-methylgalactoside transporter [Christensenellaceae bacterium]|jgi:methyl-galactoside transport system permease protein|nr:beta-methylgalactoside transporter [Christensenellaceae bacterium]
MQVKPANFNTKTISNFLVNNAILLLMIVVAVSVGIARPAFFSAYNAKNLISNTSIRFLVALGVSGCLITCGTDLSAGRMVGLSACLAATFLQRADYSGRIYANMPEPNMLLVLLGVVLIATIFGLLNGIVIAYLKVPPFIATLGMQTIIYGICQIYTGSQPIGGLRSDYTVGLASGSLFGITWLPYLGLIALVLGLIFWFVYNKTPHGKYMYAIGGNENAAEVSGINTGGTKIIIYITAAAMYGVAGFLLGGKAGGASVGLGPGYELEAIAGCTIGGVSTNGGVGRVSGILIGVLVFELLKIAMQFIGVESNYTYIVQGIVIITAVALDMRKYAAKK